MKQFVVCGIALSIVASVLATDINWIGPTSGNAEWTATENWQGGVMPGANDCAVFGEGIGKLSIINTTASAMTIYVKDFVVRSGTITFERSDNTTYNLNNATNLFTISPGAKVIWECNSGISANNVISIHVAGGGTWQGPKYNGARLGTTGYGGLYLREVRAKEGSTVTFPGHSSYIYRYVAEKDATLSIQAISSLHGFEIFEAERGGTININNGNGNNTVGAIRGEGTVNFTSTGYNYPVKNCNGPNVFSGILNHNGDGSTLFSTTVDEINNRFTIGASNSLENVKNFSPRETRLDFATGIGTFYFGKLNGTNTNPIVTQDLAGEPIELRTKGIGARTFLTGPGSWYNTVSCTITGEQVRVKGKVTSNPGLTFGANASFVNNEMQLAVSTIRADGKLILSGPGIDTYNSRSTSLNGYRDTMLTLPLKQGIEFNSVGAGASLVVESNAVLRVTSAVQSKLPSFTLRDGGTLYLMRRDYGWTSSGNENAYTLDADGGVIELCNYTMPYYANPISATDAAKWTCRVGTGGLTFRARGIQAMSYDVGWPMASTSYVGEGRDGGITQDGAGSLSVTAPQALTGPITLRDGVISVKNAAVTGSSGMPLGTGDIVFEGGQLSSTSAYGGTRYFASGAGSKFRINGAGRFAFTNAVEIGNIERTRGGVLFLDANVLDGVTASLKVSSGVAGYADGRPYAPIVYNKNLTGLHFVRYDAEQGFIPFTEGDYTAGLDGGASSVALVKQSTRVTVAANETKQVSALRVQKDTDNNANSSITLSAGSTLRVGDGTNPAVVLLASNGGSNGHAFNAITGAGTLDFGTSEGVFVMPKRSNGSYTPVATVSAKISGSGGLTLAGVPSADNASANKLLTLSGDNNFTGGLTVENLMVDAGSTTAFGENKVTVKGGHWHGATVNFPTADRVCANDFQIRGNGYYLFNRFTSNQTAFGGTACGAIRFGAPRVKLTGKVEIDDWARITSMFNNAGDAAEIAGVISGGKLQIVYSKNLPIALSGANTYTGGTWVVASKLVLRDGTLGTGPVELDDSTLRFENTTATTIPNRIRGNGTLELAGEGEVSFTGNVSEYAPTAVDLCGGRRTFTSFPAFMTSFINSASTRATIAIPGNLGTVKWHVTSIDNCDNVILDIGKGTTLDLNGHDITVRRNEGKGTAINGKLTETHPLNRFFLIIK